MLEFVESATSWLLILTIIMPILIFLIPSIWIEMQAHNMGRYGDSWHKRRQMFQQTILWGCIGSFFSLYLLFAQIRDSLIVDMLNREGVAATAVVTDLQARGSRGVTYWVDYTFTMADSNRTIETSSQISDSRYDELTKDGTVPILYARSKPEVACLTKGCMALESGWRQGIGAVLVALFSWWMAAGNYHEYKTRYFW